jgi:hypothetical protein
MILAAEQAIVARLKAALAPLPVEALPSRGYRFASGKGAAVVSAMALDAGGVEDAGASVQGAVLTVEVALFARSLRDGAGVWDLFEAARRALLSFKPAPGATPLMLRSARLLDAEADTWTLSTQWQTRLPLAPDLDYDGGPLLTRVTFEGDTA